MTYKLPNQNRNFIGTAIADSFTDPDTGEEMVPIHIGKTMVIYDAKSRTNKLSRFPTIEEVAGKKEIKYLNQDLRTGEYFIGPKWLHDAWKMMRSVLIGIWDAMPNFMGNLTWTRLAAAFIVYLAVFGMIATIVNGPDIFRGLQKVMDNFLH